MKALPWIVAAAGIGAAAYFIATAPGPQWEAQNPTGSDAVEGAASSTANWGTKTRMRGAGGKFVGKAKQAIGDLTGNDRLASEGAGDELAGSAADAVGNLAQAAGQTIHDLNR
jgi:uncharacterized protein YjbJ (UPF0337 family)